MARNHIMFIMRTASHHKEGISLAHILQDSTMVRKKEDWMKIETLRDLYVEQLQDLYSAETQLVEALPKMAKAASHAQLKTAFTEHLTQTKGHVQRLEQIFTQLGEDTKGPTCKGMKGLISE